MSHSSKTGEIGKLYNEYDYILKTFEFKKLIKFKFYKS